MHLYSCELAQAMSLLEGSAQISEIMQQTGTSYTVTTVSCPDE